MCWCNDGLVHYTAISANAIGVGNNSMTHQAIRQCTGDIVFHCGWVHGCGVSIACALEIPQPCIKPLKMSCAPDLSLSQLACSLPVLHTWGMFVCLQFPNGKEMQINLTGFLNARNARQFMTELWVLLLSAQDNIGGIPAKFMEQKKEEIKRRQVSEKSLLVQVMAWCHQATSYYLNQCWMWTWYRADSRFARSQWETALLCNNVSLAERKHWITPVVPLSETWMFCQFNNVSQTLMVSNDCLSE